MKNAIITLIILLCTCIVCGAFIILNKSNRENQEVNDTPTNETTNATNNTKKESEDKMILNMKVIINGKTYNAALEDNETAQMFISMLPKEFNMNELNGNEKYIYLDNSLPTNSYDPKHIEAGDIMLYGNNCLVVFYKSFDTSYSYTKIGHIDNLPNLGDKNITIKFEK